MKKIYCGIATSSAVTLFLTAAVAEAASQQLKALGSRVKTRLQGFKTAGSATAEYSRLM